MMKFGMRVQTWDSLPKANFIKIAKGYTLFGKIYTKIYKFWQYLQILALLGA